jgi:hypothetical protein
MKQICSTRVTRHHEARLEPEAMVLREHCERVRADRQTERLGRVLGPPAGERGGQDRRAQTTAPAVLVRRDGANPAVIRVNARDRDGVRDARDPHVPRGIDQSACKLVEAHVQVVLERLGKREHLGQILGGRAPHVVGNPEWRVRRRVEPEEGAGFPARESRLGEQGLAPPVISSRHGPELGCSVLLSRAQRHGEERPADSPAARGGLYDRAVYEPDLAPRVALDAAEPDDLAGLAGDVQGLGRRYGPACELALEIGSLGPLPVSEGLVGARGAGSSELGDGFGLVGAERVDVDVELGMLGFGRHLHWTMPSAASSPGLMV